MINQYQSKYFAFELSKKASVDSQEEFVVSLMRTTVEFNPYQDETDFKT
jgi:hypothetical protein